VTVEEERDEALKEVGELRKRIVELDEALKEVGELRKRIAELEKIIKEWDRGFRQRHRRFSSRPEGAKRGPAKTPGQRAGHKASHRSKPAEVDTTVEHPVPSSCECGGVVEALGTQAEVIVEDLPRAPIERTRHIAHEGRCQRCGNVRRAKLPGAPDAGAIVNPVVLGDRALELGVSLRFEHHLPLRHVADVFKSFFGLRITHGAVSHAMVRTALHAAPALTEIHNHIRDAAVVGSDETSWRQNGAVHWVWLLRTPQASLFHVTERRNAETFDALFPRGFIGVLVTDCYAVYTRRKDLLHSYCGAHLMCEAKKILELEPSPAASEFVHDYRWLLRRSELARETGDLDELDAMRRKFHFLATSARYQGDDDIKRLQARLKKYEPSFTMFLSRADIPWNNNATERDLRPFCLQRKVARQTRSDRGALALGTWMSVTQTLRKNDLPVGPWVAQSQKNRRHRRPPPSVFRPDPD
jgi:transposase